MFGFRFFNTAKEPERLIPFTIGKGESPAHEELEASSEKPRRIRPAFLDARFARIKRNQTEIGLPYIEEDDITRFPETEEAELEHFEEEEFEIEQNESFEYETELEQGSLEEDTTESVSSRLVQYSSKLGALTPRGNHLRFQKTEQGATSGSQSSSIDFSPVEEEEKSLSWSDGSIETVQFSLQSNYDSIDDDIEEEVPLAPSKPILPDKVEKISYQPKPLITRLTKQRSQQAKAANVTKPDHAISPFSPSPGLGKASFGSTGIKPVAEVTHKWPSLPKSFSSEDFRSSIGRSSASMKNAAAESMTPQRQVSIKDYTDAPNFMRGAETSRAASSVESETVDIKEWSEKLDALLSDSLTGKILNQNQSSFFKKDSGNNPYEWKTGF